MNRGITKENLLLILPPALGRDPSALALAEAAAEALTARLEEIDRARVISNIDGLDEAVLDILARDFKVDWWDANYSISEKRRTLKDSWRVHKKLGTKAAVETAISAIFQGTKVQEWWEYEGGEPYHFRLYLNAGEVRPDTAKLKKVLERANYYKSLRSHLDGFVWNFNGEPFIETPGHLVFRQFAAALVFTHLRGCRFNGAVDFGRDDVMFDQSGAGLGFPRFQIAPLRFTHFNNAFSFDGNADFNGGVDFDQAYGFMGLPTLQISGRIAGRKERMSIRHVSRAVFSNKRGGLRFEGLPVFDGSITFDQDGGGVRLREYRLCAPVRKHSERFGGKITMDNQRTFNSEINFDSALIFNAYIKEEEL